MIPIPWWVLELFKDLFNDPEATTQSGEEGDTVVWGT